MKYDQLLVLGDSHTEYSTQFTNGFARRFADHYARKLDITIRGFSGYTSHMLRLSFPHIKESLGSAKLAAAVLFIGTNDSAQPSEGQHVPIDQCEQNITWLVKKLYELTPIVVLVTPTIVDETRAPEHSDKLSAEYAKRIVTIGENTGAPVVQLRDLFGMNYDLLNDGLHFTDTGYSIASTAILEALEAAGLRADGLPLKLPLWTQLIGIDDDKIVKLIDESDRK